MKRLLFFYVIIYLWSGFCKAQTTIHPSKFTGSEIISGISPEEARSRAIRKVRLEAIEKLCGVNIQSASLVKDFILSGDFVSSTSFGQIVSENILKEEVIITQEQINHPPTLVYHVEMEIAVQCESGEPDLTFRLSVQTNKKTFVSGEELILNLQSTSDCYLTILNYTADEKVSIIMPSSIFPDNFLPAQQPLEIPSRSQRAQGIQLRMQPLSGQEKSTEIIQIIATKQKIDFLENLETKEEMNGGLNLSIAMDKLLRWITSIPVQQRTQATEMIEVHHQ